MNSYKFILWAFLSDVCRPRFSGVFFIGSGNAFWMHFVWISERVLTNFGLNLFQVVPKSAKIWFQLEKIYVHFWRKTGKKPFLWKNLLKTYFFAQSAMWRICVNPVESREMPYHKNERISVCGKPYLTYVRWKNRY